MMKTFQVATITLNPALDITLTIGNFTAGAVNRVETVRSKPGGKGVNVAAALADYGISVAATGLLGNENCEVFEQFFKHKSIANYFSIISGQTRSGIKILDPISLQTTDINFPGPQVDLSVANNLQEKIKLLNADWFVLAGSLPPGLEATTYRDIIRQLKSRNCHVILDSSGPALRHAIEAAPDVIKPNIAELEELVGYQLTNDETIISAAKSLLKQGIRQVIISMGDRGAYFISAEETFLALPPQIEIRSTVGAGDAMVAGLVAGHLTGLSVHDQARLATAFSLDILTHDGAGLSSKESVKKFYSLVQIKN
jgi:1-phosphofructokinase